MKRSFVGSVRVISTAMVTQAIGSLTNFVLSLYLLRSMTLDEFGLFGIAFAIMIFLIGFWQSFFITQYIVLAPNECPEQFPPQVYAAMAYTSIGAVFLVLIIASILQLFANLGLFTLGVGSSAVFFSIKEFQIRHAFHIGKGGQAVLINSIMAVSLTVALFLLALSGAELQADVAFTIYALAAMAAMFTGHFYSGLRLTGHNRKDILATLFKVARGGRWAIATNLVFSLRNNAHLIIVAGILGPSAVAIVNAARLFVTPPILFLPALSNVVLPLFAQAFQRGGHMALQRAQRQTTVAMTAAALLYSVILLLAWPFLEPIVVDEQYQGLTPMIATWCAFVIVLILRSVVDWGVQVEQRFSLITKVSSYSAFVALGAAWVLTLWTGPIGAVLALVVAEFMMATTLLMAHGKRSRI